MTKKLTEARLNRTKKVPEPESQLVPLTTYPPDGAAT